MNTTTTETTTAHTPAPWRYEPGTKTIRSVPANYWIATLDSWDGAVNNESNARLIAAAPELLEAAEALMDVLRELPRGPQHDAMVNLHYIIAKAKGEL